MALQGCMADGPQACFRIGVPGGEVSFIALGGHGQDLDFCGRDRAGLVNPVLKTTGNSSSDLAFRLSVGQPSVCNRTCRSWPSGVRNRRTMWTAPA